MNCTISKDLLIEFIIIMFVTTIVALTGNLLNIAIYDPRTFTRKANGRMQIMLKII